MRTLTAAVAALVLVSAVEARAQRIETMLPVPPLPSIGLPLPHIGIPPDESKLSGTTTPTTGTIGTRRNDTPINVGGVGYLPPYFYLAPWYFTPPPESAAVTRTDAPAGRSARANDQPTPATGTLWLDLQPVTPMQVFVDGYYLGTTDMTGSSFELEAGPHRVELKADGYETIGFDVRIVRQQSITYRDTVKAAAHSSERKETKATAVPRAKMYVIPGCYAGNQPPDKVALPAGCDASNVTTIER